MSSVLVLLLVLFCFAFVMLAGRAVVFFLVEDVGQIVRSMGCQCPGLRHS